MTARQTPGRHALRISESIVRRRLAISGLHARRPYVGAEQTTGIGKSSSKRIRLRMNTVLFSDKSRFTRVVLMGVRVWRRSGTVVYWKLTAGEVEA